MRRAPTRGRLVSALAAALALLCQTVLAVPIAEGMALERMPAPVHRDCMGMGGMGAHEPGTPTKPDQSKHDHHSCLFCATAALFGLNAAANGALFTPRALSAHVGLTALFHPLIRAKRAHQSRAPPPPAIV